MIKTERTLEEQRIEFANRKFIATPLAGLIVWTIAGLAGLFFSDRIAVYTIFIGTGAIVYLGLFLSKLTGENFLDKDKPKNAFDQLFFSFILRSREKHNTVKNELQTSSIG